MIRESLLRRDSRYSRSVSHHKKQISQFMKLWILLFLIATSCNNSKSSNFQTQLEIKSELELNRDIEIEKTEVEEKDYETTDLSAIDTIFAFENGLKLRLISTDSTGIKLFDIPKKDLDSLLVLGNQNRHLEALEIENYLISKTVNNYRKDSIDRFVKLLNGEWMKVHLNKHYEEADQTFERYFEETGYYLFRVQLFEGNYYKLINNKNGKETILRGRPFWSPNNEFVISVISDIDAGYSANGLSIYKLRTGELSEIAFISPIDWGPSAAKWTSNNEIILLCDYYSDNYTIIQEYVKLKIEYDD